MKIIVVVIVYNRFENLKHWLKCWQKCETDGAELIVIHTGNEVNKFGEVCSGIAKYIHRENIGFDIGSLQDVCKERLTGFPNDWDYLLWCTDDTFPMQRGFITPFIETIQKSNVGLACMQISKSSPGNIIHVRTTGICLSKEVSKRLTFPADPVRTKQDCYHFEHRGGRQTLTEQIRAMGLDVVQVAPNNISPLWDKGYWKRLDRQIEHENVFGQDKPRGNKVTFISTIYNSYPQIISSLLLQTHQNWELILIHDGQAPDSVRSVIPEDKRIQFIETFERIGNWGHKNRQWALDSFDLGDYVVITNADNYYAPTFIEYMLKGFNKSHTAVATYCDKIVHSYKAWEILQCKFERGYIDCGSVMVKSDIAKEIGWRVTDEHSADWVFFSDIAAKYSPSNFIKVPGCLFVHN